MALWNHRHTTGSFSAVSYTHLDVYKRQNLRVPLRNVLIYILCNLGPVSYTHLSKALRITNLILHVIVSLKYGVIAAGIGFYHRLTVFLSLIHISFFKYKSSMMVVSSYAATVQAIPVLLLLHL